MFFDANTAILVSAFLLPFFIGLMAFFILKNANPIISLRIQFISTIINSIPLLIIAFLLYSYQSPENIQNSPIRITGLKNFLMVDHLSVYHMLIMVLVFIASSFYSQFYFKDEILLDANDETKNNFKRTTYARFTGLWNLTMASMTLVLLSNHIVLMWFALEATTLSTTFLICTNKHKNSVEAMWKYIIICSIGLSIALIGTILFAYAARGVVVGDNIWLWTSLMANGSLLNPMLVKMGYIFIVIGYGTKAGIAPMHTWLPDAHGEAPAPISAIFSGFMLSLAFYVILRFMPIASLATNHNGFAYNVLTLMGVISLTISTIFMIHQKHLKRLLAYCSVEHMGIISLGFGLGPLGYFVALFHTLNHSLSKILAFYASGMLGKVFHTQEMPEIKSVMKVSPYWGGALIVSVLTLIGVAPFAVFMSEYKLLMNIINQRAWFSLTFFVVSFLFT